MHLRLSKSIDARPVQSIVYTMHYPRYALHPISAHQLQLHSCGTLHHTNPKHRIQSTLIPHIGRNTRKTHTHTHTRKQEKKHFPSHIHHHTWAKLVRKQFAIKVIFSVMGSRHARSKAFSAKVLRAPALGPTYIVRSAAQPLNGSAHHVVAMQWEWRICCFEDLHLTMHARGAEEARAKCRWFPNRFPVLPRPHKGSSPISRK